MNTFIRVLTSTMAVPTAWNDPIHLETINEVLQVSDCCRGRRRQERDSRCSNASAVRLTKPA